MKYSIIFSAISLFSFHQIAQALPAKRDQGITDIDVLNFALTLEHLENFFYTEGLKKYSQEDFVAVGLPEFARDRWEQIAYHERTHVEFLTSAIEGAGGRAVEPCTYHFGDTNAREWAIISEALETVGTDAYTGASQFIQDKSYLTAAASILATEARQAAWINSAALKANPWSTPFETPLGFSQARTLASKFIVSCPPNNPEIPGHVFPALGIPDNIKPGDRIKLDFAHPQEDKPLWVVFENGLGPFFAPLERNEVVVPKELKGVVYIYIVNDKKLTDETTFAGPAIAMINFNSRDEIIIGNNHD